MCQPSLTMQTAKQQFEPQRASWKKIIYSSVFAAGITLNHTQSLHLLGMLSVWDQNKSNTVGSPHPFLQIAFFRNLEPRKREWCLHRYKCLICPWTTDRGRQARLNVRAWLMAVSFQSINSIWIISDPHHFTLPLAYSTHDGIIHKTRITFYLFFLYWPALLYKSLICMHRRIISPCPVSRGLFLLVPFGFEFKTRKGKVS